MNIKRAYQYGYDCGFNGPSDTNCHFSIFGSKDNTQAWEKGKALGEAHRAKTYTEVTTKHAVRTTQK